MHAMVTSLKDLFEQNANPEQAGPMAAYMRNQFSYLGIKNPQSSALQKQFYAIQGLPVTNELGPILHDLWSLPEREFQYAGISLLGKLEKKLPSEFIATLEYLLITKSWWDTVDSIAAGAIGTHFQRFPDVRAECLARWRLSDNFWLRRTTILFQLGYKKRPISPCCAQSLVTTWARRSFLLTKPLAGHYDNIRGWMRKACVILWHKPPCTRSALARLSSGWNAEPNKILIALAL